MGKFYSKQRIVLAFRINIPSEIVASDYYLKISPGDWMLHDERGHHIFVTDETFRSIYAPVDRDAKAMFNTTKDDILRSFNDNRPGVPPTN